MVVVVDNGFLDESYIDCNIMALQWPPGWHFYPCDHASKFCPLDFQAYVYEEDNGLPSCNHQYPDGGSSLVRALRWCQQVEEMLDIQCEFPLLARTRFALWTPVYVGTFIRWTVTASSTFNAVKATKYCGICI